MRKYTSLPYIEKPVANGNFGPQSDRKPIKGITIHTTDGTLAGTLAWFNNPKSQASSTYVVDINGQIYAMLEEYFVPYTNGNYASNQECITIENVDNGNPNAARDERQIQANIKLVRDIALFYNLPIDRNTIKGHREIPPYTHPQCPGSMPLDRIAQEAAQSPTTSINYKAIVDESKRYVYGYNTEGTVTQRMAKIIEIYKKYGVTKA